MVIDVTPNWKIPSNEEDVPHSDSYALNVVDIPNRNSSVDVNNLRLVIALEGVVFKVDYNTILEDMCTVYRPNIVEISGEKFSPIFLKIPSIEGEVIGSNTVIIGCEKLLPDDIFSFKIYTDKNGICNYRCSSNKGYSAEYRWDSYYETNKEFLTGDIYSEVGIITIST